MSATALAVLHKFIRREMFDFSQRMFRAAPRDVPAVQAALRDVAALLHTHATQEEARLEPLLRSLDAELAERVLRDHDKLDAELARLCTMAEKLDPDTDSCVDSLSQLHLDWNRFLGAYLLHLDDEERTLFVRLQEHMPLAAIAQSPAAQDPEQGQSFLDRLWAVTTPMERSIVEHARDPRTLQHTDARFNSRIDVRGDAVRDALFLSCRLQLREARFEILAQERLHTDEHRQQLRQIRHRPIHRPHDVRAAAIGRQIELRYVAGRHRLDEVQVDRDGRRGDRGDLHSARTHIAIASPFVNRPHARQFAFERACHVRIQFFPGRPSAPIAEVGHEGLHLLRRSSDGRRALEVKGVWFRGCKNQDGDNQQAASQGDFFEHRTLQWKLSCSTKDVRDQLDATCYSLKIGTTM